MSQTVASLESGASAADAGPQTTVFVCVTCRLASEDAPADASRAGERLLDAIAALPEAAGFAVVPVECLSNCNRSCTVAVAASGKWTYVLGALDPAEHARDVLSFAGLHAAHPEGVPVWRDRPQHIRKNTISRVPPLPAAPRPSSEPNPEPAAP